LVETLREYAGLMRATHREEAARELEARADALVQDQAAVRPLRADSTNSQE
jgi:hypothetical protein